MIKIGQIGIGHNHAEGKMKAVRKFPELFEVVGICEQDERWISERKRLDVYKDLPFMGCDELLDKVDAVLVECDVWDLTKTAQKCISAGKHIHMDKPASGTFTEYEKLLKAAKFKNLTIQLGYMYRYNPAIRKCMDMIQNGELGEIYQINAEMSTYHSPEYRIWLKNFKGGSMYIFGSHLIDLIISILGMPEKVTSFIKQTGFMDVSADDNCFAVLEYKKAIAKVTNLSVEVNGWGMRQIVVSGSLGTVEIKPLEVPVKMTKSTTGFASNAYADMKETINVLDVPEDTRYDEMMRDFYLFATGKKSNPYTCEHELIVQKALLMACENFPQV
jgi:predicted dehydrogenase